MSEERPMSFNARSGYFEGWTRDGKLVTVEQAFWQRMQRREKADDLLSPWFWIRQDTMSVCVYGAQSFQAMVRLAQAGSILCTTGWPVSLRSGQLIPRAYVRATPLGFGLRLVFSEEVEGFLAGHIKKEYAVHAILQANGLTSLELWEITDPSFKGIPLPEERPYRGDTLPYRERAKMAERIFTLLYQTIVVEGSSAGAAEVLDQDDPAQLAAAKALFPDLARQIGSWFLEEYLPSLEEWHQSHGSGARPTGEELAYLVEAVLWQRYWER